MEILSISFAAYLLVQLYVIWRAAGRWRLVAALPLAAMLPLSIAAAVGWSQGDLLWTLRLLLASPLALWFVASVALGFWPRRRWQPGGEGGERPGTEV